jgi:hypothetical protein
MTLQDIYFVTEIVGGIAIVASLIFVALQVRQNTEAMRAAAIERHADHFRALNLPVIESAEFAEILVRGLRNLDDLTEIERVRFIASMTASIRGWEAMFLVHERGALDRDVWRTSSETFKSVFAHPGALSYWRIRRFTFSPGFQAYVEELIQEGGAQPLWDIGDRTT